jgi:hypothetical protein
VFHDFELSVLGVRLVCLYVNKQQIQILVLVIIVVLPEECRPPICDKRTYESNHRGHCLCLLKTGQFVDSVTFSGRCCCF